MIYAISSYLTLLLLREQIILEEEREVYTYGFEITIANGINALIIFCVGFALHSIRDAILFYMVFVSLRFFCGGYHADSYIKCFFSFAITSAVCLITAKCLFCQPKIIAILFLIGILSLGWYIWKWAPIENENRPITLEERKLFRKRSIELYYFLTIVGIILWMAGQIKLTATLISTFIVVSILMFYKEGGRT